MISEEKKILPSNIMEGFISIKSVIEGNTIYKTTNRKVLKVFYDKDKEKQREKELKYLNNKSKELDFSIEPVSSDFIKENSLSQTNGGLIALCSERTLNDISNANIKENGFYVLIEGIEDPYNFGYCIRSLYSFGVDGIILNPRNWMSASGIVCRSSAGTSELLNIYTSDTFDAIKKLKDLGYKCISTDLSPRAKSIFDIDLRFPLLLIIGGEKRGLTKIALDNSDDIVKIDYSRKFGSALTSASSATILGYEVFRQNKGVKCD